MEGVEEIIRQRAEQRGTLLVTLQEIRSRLGSIPDEAVRQVAAGYGMSEAEVRGVLEFYSELRTSPPGQHRVCVCRGDSCAATGARELAATVEAALGIRAGGTTPDGRFSYDHVFCLGNCALSPSLAIDGEVHARLTPAQIKRRLEDVAGD